MNIQKIQQLEEEIKDLFYDIGKKDFWDFHARVVIEKSKELAKKYDGDLEIVWLGAILHDIARLDGVEPHDEIGAKRAYDMLIEKGFEKEVAEKVQAVIFTHRCRNHQPKNLEQKIITSADALSHFAAPFYLWVASVTDNEFPEFLKKYSEKLERDYNDKIFFEEERDAFKNEYAVLKNWLNYKKLK